jgi:uncharacterized protein (DUF1778 family)
MNPVRSRRAMRPKKAKADRKAKVVQIRMTDEQQRELQQAADRAGADLSTWMRMVALDRARQKPSG